MIFYYYSPEKIIEALGTKEALRLTDNGDGQLDIERIKEAEKFAETIIDSYLTGRYSLHFDFDNIPPLIELIAKDLTIIHLYEAAYTKMSVPNAIVLKKIDTYKLLKQLQNGEIQLNWREYQPPFILVRKNQSLINEL